MEKETKQRIDRERRRKRKRGVKQREENGRERI